MANGHGGVRAGAGKPKGSKNKSTLRQMALLSTVEESFKAADYDPLRCMIVLAQKDILEPDDHIKFGFHLALAKKYYADLAALKVDATVELAPITVVERHFKADTNGHVRNTDAVQI